MQRIKFFNQNQTHSCINLIILRNDNIVCIILVNKTRCLNLIKKKNLKYCTLLTFSEKKKKKIPYLGFTLQQKYIYMKVGNYDTYLL